MGPAVDDVQLLAGHGAAPPDDSGGIYDWDAAAAAPWNMAEAQAALAMVTEAMDEMWADDRWIGKRNREDLTEPVRRLRASAQRVGLLRVSRGQLLATKIGTALRDDPPALFRHLAERLAGRPRDGFARMATPLVLLSVAAGRSHREPVAKLLTAAGWSTRWRCGLSLRTWPRRERRGLRARLRRRLARDRLADRGGDHRRPRPRPRRAGLGSLSCPGAPL